jgi:hypothetical protein
MMPARLFVLPLVLCMVGHLSGQTTPDPVTPELYALMTDHLGTDTGPEGICGIGSVTGRPFVARRVITSLEKATTSGAQNSDAPHSFLIARDRFGRVRCEIGYIEPGFGPVHERVQLGTYIYDPVEQTHSTIYPQSFHTAYVIPFTLMDPVFAKGSPVFSFCALSVLQDGHCIRKIREAWKDKVVSTAELGSHIISGLDASGYTAVVESGDGTNVLRNNLEQWVSMDDALLLRESRHVGESFTRTLAVTDLQLQDPPAALFEIPQGDVIHRVSTVPQELSDLAQVQ